MERNIIDLFKPPVSSEYRCDAVSYSAVYYILSARHASQYSVQRWVTAQWECIHWQHQLSLQLALNCWHGTGKEVADKRSCPNAGTCFEHQTGRVLWHLLCRSILWLVVVAYPSDIVLVATLAALVLSNISASTSVSQDTSISARHALDTCERW